MACSSGCRTPGAHTTYGECLRDKSIQIDRQALAHGQAAEKRKNYELDQYEHARKHGLQPEGTSLAQTRAAVAEAEAA